VNSAVAGIFMVQGRGSLDSKRYGLASHDYALATVNALLGKDELNAGRSLNVLTEDCLPHINVDDLKSNKPVTETVGVLIAELNSRNQNGRFTDMITKIERLISEAKKRNEKTGA
jgi:hypothetical protein